jgi:cytochrome P450
MTEVTNEESSGEFDHHSPMFAEEFRTLSAKCPVIHSNKHGGFSVLTKYSDVKTAARDFTRFSSENDIEGVSRGGKGIIIPSSTVSLGVLEMDPPEHRGIRALLSRVVSPSAVDGFEARMRELAIESIADCVDRESFDVMADLATPFSARADFEFMGLPPDEWRFFIRPLSEHVYFTPADPEFPQVQERMEQARLRMLEIIADRRASSTGDIFSQLAHADLDGRTLRDDEIVQITWQLLDAGFDTIASTICHIMLCLTERPDIRKRLVDDHSLIPSAIEEFLRYYSTVTGIARTAMEDVVVNDELLPAGQPVLLCYGAANFDPDAWDNPEEIDIERHPNRHLTFGDGIHRCLGARFSRSMLRIFMEELLERMPDFVVDRDAAEHRAIIVPNNSFVTMPATPSQPEGP